MLRRGFRRFDLYDFFSVFLPGATGLLGVLPFAPETATFGPGLVGALIVLGFVVGRGVHSIAISLDELLGQQGHRELFCAELERPNHVAPSLIHEFEVAYNSVCGLNSVVEGVDSEQTDTSLDRSTVLSSLTAERETACSSELTSLYTLVRSYVHIDSRGRSRTFQAIYSFHRSMWIVTLSLSGLYFLYGAGRSFGVFETRELYTSLIGSVQLPTLVLVTGPLLATSLAHGVAKDGRRRHRRNYVQYLVADFVTLYEVEESIDDREPTDGSRREPPRR